MSTYTPTPASITAFTAVTDGSTEDAALFAPFFEGLANQAAWVADGGDASALNWSNGGATAHNLKKLAYFDQYGAWFGVGDGGNNFLEVSYDFGKTWHDLAADLATAKVLLDVVVSPYDGWAVLMTSTRDVYKGTHTGFGAYSWALTANALTTAPTAGVVEYDLTAGLFLACYRVTTTGFRVDTSPDGVTWTSRAVPATFTAYTGTNNPEVGAVAGRAIALFASMSGASKVETAYSTDGGVTWAGVTLSSGLTVGDATRITRPIYDPNTGAWWFCLSSATSDKAELWTSTDGGVSWAVVKTFTAKDVEVESAAMVGPVWTMCTKKGRIMVSKDYGATWRWVAANDGTASAFAMRGAGGGAVIVNASDKTSFSSHRAGRTAGTVV